MNFNKIFFVFIVIFIFSCTEKTTKLNYNKNFNNYSNKGFALIYNDDLLKNKIINRKIDERSLLIFNNNLKNETQVKITNLLNGKYLIAKVGKKSKYPFFYNSVISKRISNTLEINIDEPYVEIKTINLNDSFIANKAKTFKEEKKVANKAPVKSISIKNISLTNDKVKQNIKINEKKLINFNYDLKIADLYFEDSANILLNRLINDYNITDVKVKKISKNTYRVYKGPFKNLESLIKAYNDIIKLNFENIEIIKL